MSVEAIGSVIIDLDLIGPLSSRERSPPGSSAARGGRVRGHPPFGSDAARAYGRVHAAVLAAGRQPRRRFADLLIAASAVAEGLPLVARNPQDYAGLEELVDVIAV